MNYLTAAENVELAKQVCKSPMEPEEALRIVGLKDRVHNFPAQLSGGEQQRVAIARAISGDPELLLADEPTGNLDPDLSQKIMDLLRKIASRGTTVIVATHNYEMVKRVEARAIHIESGRVLVQ